MLHDNEAIHRAYETRAKGLGRECMVDVMTRGHEITP